MADNINFFQNLNLKAFKKTSCSNAAASISCLKLPFLAVLLRISQIKMDYPHMALRIKF